MWVHICQFIYFPGNMIVELDKKASLNEHRGNYGVNKIPIDKERESKHFTCPSLLASESLC